MFIGFLGYADVGGLHVKNVAYVFFIVLVYSLSWIPMVPIANDLGGCSAVSYTAIAFCPVVVGVALILTIIDKRISTGRATPTGEASPILPK